MQDTYRVGMYSRYARDDQGHDVGLYLRLSRDDNNGNMESMSIANQRQLLMTYVQEKGWNVKEVYVDDGWSGANFDRPDFKRMIQDIEKRKINCVITKDLSRLGRNYIKTGYYTEEFFPEMGVRYIAINDSIDTAQQNNDIAPFHNILNEWYPKQVSQKVRQVKKSSAMQGKFMGSHAPYGYTKSPEDKHILIVDEEAARVVRRIFELYVSGENGRMIAARLNEEKVDCPRERHYKITGKPNPFKNQSATWGSTMVLQIMKNPVYLGKLVQGKRTVVSFKSKKRVFTDPEDWIVVENTHEAIITQETWDKAQKIAAINKRTCKTYDNKIGLFSGIVKCADCKSSMASSIRRSAKGDFRTYKCCRYNEHGKEVCSSHTIREYELAALVIADIRQHAKLAAADADMVIRELMAASNANQTEELRFCKQKLAESKRRISIIDDSAKKLFDEKCAGNIPDAMFKNLMFNYDKERTELETTVAGMMANVAEMESQSQDAAVWVERVRNHLDIQELDRAAVLDLIDSIFVSEPYVVNGKKNQDIKIKYKFVGCLDAKQIEDIAV